MRIDLEKPVHIFSCLVYPVYMKKKDSGIVECLQTELGGLNVDVEWSSGKYTWLLLWRIHV